MSPVRYSSALEVVGEDEARLTDAIIARIVAESAAAFDRHAHAMRSAHAKSHAILKGELIVAADLPADLAQGVFAPGRRYEVLARLSSSPGDIQTDTIPAPRGFAIKLIGVEGERLAHDIPGANQDFLMVNFPALPFGTPARYLSALGMLEATQAAPEIVQRALAGAADAAKALLTTVGVEPGAMIDALARDNHHPLGETYHSQGALRFGDYVAKLALAPKSANVRALTGVALEDVKFATLRDAVARFFETEAAEYELSAQLCADAQAMPIEDVSVAWDEAHSPHRPLATLRFSAQASYSPARRVYGDESLAFNPWNGVEAHRPLGGIMRIRRAVYAASMKYRMEMNARARIEPGRLQDAPD